MLGEIHLEGGSYFTFLGMVAVNDEKKNGRKRGQVDGVQLLEIKQ